MKKIGQISVICFVLALVSCSKHDFIIPTTNTPPSSTVKDTITITVTISGIKIPENVTKELYIKYSGYSIFKIEKECEHGKDYYKVKIKKGKSKIELIYTDKWVFVRIKD